MQSVVSFKTIPAPTLDSVSIHKNAATNVRKTCVTGHSELARYLLKSRICIQLLISPRSHQGALSLMMRLSLPLFASDLGSNNSLPAFSVRRTTLLLTLSHITHSCKNAQGSVHARHDLIKDELFAVCQAIYKNSELYQKGDISADSLHNISILDVP